MTNRFELPFRTVDSTAPSFEKAFAASTAFALESTLRAWDGPGSRSVRFASQGADDYYLAFGTSDIVASSSEAILLLGGTVEVFTPIKPSYTHIALFSSTDVTANITLGYGQ